MMNTIAVSNTNVIATCLINRGLLDSAKIQQLQPLLSTKQNIFNYLIENNFIDASTLAMAITEEFGLPLIDLYAVEKELMPLNLVHEKLIEQHQALPLYRRGDHLYVALADPTNTAALHEFRFHTGLKTHAVIVEVNKLTRLIEEILNQNSAATLIEVNDAELNHNDINAALINTHQLSASSADDAPIVKFVHKVLFDAIKKNVSDIHFEPYDHHYRIRFRKDGILYEAGSPPINLASRITARLKIMAQLDIAERRIPQDGHFNMSYTKNHPINFRVSTCPTSFGEKIVVRILDPTKLKISIDELGYEIKQQTLFVQAIQRPQGMVLVTGPTGSGKTVTLYTALHILNTIDLNIATIEDPIEIQISGINQVQVNTKAGLDFSTALRAFLRQDPDVIMVGEIRDLVTAEIAIKAAQTGHFVLSTLHTNSAAATITRLINMGVPTYNIANTINLIIAQRLIRKLCTHCKILSSLPAHLLLQAGFIDTDLSHLNIYSANLQGCELCQQGYDGRIGIYEMLEITPQINHIILSGENTLEIAELAIHQGMKPLWLSALEKVKAGITSLEEIYRVLERVS